MVSRICKTADPKPLSLAKFTIAMMNTSVPKSIHSTDLILEILSRSSAKSIARFRRVSKFWSSILRLQYFTDSFMTRSSTRPRLLIALEKSGELIFSSSSQNESSLIVTAEFHIRFPEDWRLQISCSPVSGLVYCPNSPTSMSRLPVICKPSTGQQISLPKPRSNKELVHSFFGYDRNKEFVHSFFGYDPIGKQFKVLFMSCDKDVAPEEHQVLTLGTGNWRLKKARLTHYPLSEGMCIDGVLYYVARRVVGGSNVVISCFDVRTEMFTLISETNGVSVWSRPSVLVNFKGKLGGIQSEWRANVDDGRFNLVLCLWVLEDVKKQEWSKRVYVLPDLWENRDVNASVSIAGVTANGEIVLSREYTHNPFYVFYYNLDSYDLRRVEIKGLEELKNYKVHAFVEHVEDIKHLTGI